MNIKFKTTLRDMQLDIDATVICDPNYGADADGNRGMTQYFVDEIIVYNKRVDITESLDQQDVDDLADLAIEKSLETNEDEVLTGYEVY